MGLLPKVVKEIEVEFAYFRDGQECQVMLPLELATVVDRVTAEADLIITTTIINRATTEQTACPFLQLAMHKDSSSTSEAADLLATDHQNPTSTDSEQVEFISFITL